MCIFLLVRTQLEGIGNVINKAPDSFWDYSSSGTLGLVVIFEMTEEDGQRKETLVGSTVNKGHGIVEYQMKGREWATEEGRS